MTGGARPLLLAFPFRGRWLVQNSPADRVPSHGTALYGTRYAIDFVAVDDRDRSAPSTWRTALATERPERFTGFGAPILAPVAGTVAVAHDGEPDHEARRSLLSQVPYALTQTRRIRSGIEAVAGNHVVLRVTPAGPFVLLAHLRAGSVVVRPGDVVAIGQTLGRCGNSGNSTEPHVHVQAVDTIDWAAARGLPIVFRALDGGAGRLPRNAEVVDAG
ncbi:M23 family metallopeptidase [Herbiconiux daphne]|uniref:M23 family metallopeptidase n=1 Tax=Herbiconiux daphne TaxID=2970914 RepID=A0ABT2H8M0_9MICO|nr:M23 family metallopeptidase [Herbiconiux daphne]MCS5736242.1 M23 family metallopeptidase [Herbiconiux daphne]